MSSGIAHDHEVVFFKVLILSYLQIKILSELMINMIIRFFILQFLFFSDFIAKRLFTKYAR